MVLLMLLLGPPPPPPQGACKGWRALAEWGGTTGAADTAAATGGAGTIINMTLLQELAGHCRVSVTDTARCVPQEAIHTSVLYTQL